MSIVGQRWKQRIIYVELADLEPEFRDALPSTEFEE